MRLRAVAPITVSLGKLNAPFRAARAFRLPDCCYAAANSNMAGSIRMVSHLAILCHDIDDIRLRHFVYPQYLVPRHRQWHPPSATALISPYLLGFPLLAPEAQVAPPHFI